MILITIVSMCVVAFIDVWRTPYRDTGLPSASHKNWEEKKTETWRMKLKSNEYQLLHINYTYWITCLNHLPITLVKFHLMAPFVVRKRNNGWETSFSEPQSILPSRGKVAPLSLAKPVWGVSVSVTIACEWRVMHGTPQEKNKSYTSSSQVEVRRRYTSTHIPSISAFEPGSCPPKRLQGKARISRPSELYLEYKVCSSA